MLRKNRRCGSVGGGASTSKKQKTLSHSDSVPEGEQSAITFQAERTGAASAAAGAKAAAVDMLDNSVDNLDMVRSAAAVAASSMVLNSGQKKMAVPTSKGQALADEYGITFFETSAKTNLNVEQVFFSIARDIKQRLRETDSKPDD